MSPDAVAETEGHPRGLKILFFTEMWERLGFYLMLGILFLYIIDTERGGLGLSAATAGEIYGTYMAFVYFTPFIGGMIADRLLGYRRSVLLGGLLLAAGYFALGVRSLPAFYTGLTLLCLGNGFFKPNISAMVGHLYADNDPRRDTGFNIFYMGINIGAAISALLAAPLRNLWSFNMAFAAAGVGMLIGVLILVTNWRQLAAADRRPVTAAADFGLRAVLLTILAPAFGFGVGGYFLGQQLPFIVHSIGPVTFGFIIGMVPIMAYFGRLVRQASPAEKPGMAALIPVYIAGGAFFMILHLSGGMITVFAEHNTDRRAEWIPQATEFYAQTAMPSYFSNAETKLSPESPDIRLLNAELLTGFLSPFFVVICTPVVVRFFFWRSRRGRPISTARKIFLGMAITALALLVMALCAKVGNNGAAKTSMWWLVWYYLVITFGELCLSPMGLSLVTKLAPKRLVGLMMGGWFLSTSIGNKLAGFISGLEPSAAIFLILAAAIAVVAAFLFALLPRLDAAIAKYEA